MKKMVIKLIFVLLCFSATATATVALAHVYVSNNGGGNVLLCHFAPDGETFDTCSPTGSGFLFPGGMGINRRTSRIYITNTLQGTIDVCTIDPEEGTLSECKKAATGFTSPYALVIKPETAMAYVNDMHGELWQCPINTDGGLAYCKNHFLSGTPQGLAASAAGFIYSVDSYFGNVNYCRLNYNGADLSHCRMTVTGLAGPSGIALTPDNHFAYITEAAGNTISRCVVQADGSLDTCIETGNDFNNPTAIMINPSGHQAYVTNSGNNTVSKCTVTEEGRLLQCAPTGSGFNVPEGILYF